MDGRVSRRRGAVLALALTVFTAAAYAADLKPQNRKIEIVAATDTSVTYREIVPPRVAVDEAAGLYHRKGCPAVKGHMPWIAPAAATLRGLRAHACPVPHEPEYSTRTEQRKPRDPSVISLLYLGNSLTYYNEIPRMTAEIARREAKPLRVDSVTRSGVSLEQLWKETESLKRIWQSHWDYVVVQGGGGGVGPLRNADVFNLYLKSFADQIRKSGATPLFYEVWSLKTPAEHEQASVASAKRVGMRLVPVGAAWHELIRTKRFDRLDWDGTHPNAFGAYLVACTVYSTIYGKPAHGAPYRFEQLAVSHEVYDDALREQKPAPEDARAIQDAAWRAVERAKKL